MRRCRAAIVVLALSVLSLVFAGPASAGGPTSVLMADPDSGTTASLYYDDPDYSALAGLVGAEQGSGTAGAVDASGASHESGAGITLTWLLHDVSVWRVDRVYLSAKGGPWISTQVNLSDSGSIWNSPAVWHRPTQGKALSALLERNGLGSGAKAGADLAAPVVPDLAAVTPEPAQQTSQPAQQTSQPASPTPTWGGWAWGLAGLALGVALTVAAPRAFSRARRKSTAPMDTEPADDETTLVRQGPPDPDDELAWTPADELSWSGSRPG